jgi:hypothetical protein
LKELMRMNCLLKDVLRDAVDTAKRAGIWQLLSMKEKEETVRYIFLNFGAVLREEAASGKRPPASKRCGACNRFSGEGDMSRDLAADEPAGAA